MRIAVFSDIHGNGLALEAVLADIQAKAPDRLVCLGDAIQGGPQPAQVVRRLRELQCPVVMGNADAWLLTGEGTGDEVITSERLQAMNEVGRRCTSTRAVWVWRIRITSPTRVSRWIIGQSTPC